MYLLIGGQLALEYGAHNILLLRAKRHCLTLLLADEVINNIGIDTLEAYLLILRLEVLDIVAVELTIHLQNIVALGLGSLHKAILCNNIIDI